MRDPFALIVCGLVTAGCAGAPRSAPTATRGARRAVAVVVAPVAPRDAAAPDPCGARVGLALAPPDAIPTRWDGEGVVTGGEAPLAIRWCGAGDVALERVTLRGDDGATVEYEFDPARTRLVRGAVVTRSLRGAARPGPAYIRVLARGADGRALEASAETRVADDPALVAARAACAAAHGAFGPVGLRGRLACNRPTRDAGRRCLSSSDCEGACLEDHVDVVSRAPDGGACGQGQTMRLHVGRCDAQTHRFGCIPRLDRVMSECVPAGLASRSAAVCVD